jgi:uncharacterized protein YggE
MKRINVLLAICLLSAPLTAQQQNNIPPVPQISVSSRAEVKVAPDRANIQISVQTKGATADAAAAENARKQKAVIDALRALKIDAKDISTAGYNVYPEQKYEANREPVIVGYNVTNTLSVEVRSLELVGRVIDAALGAGANMINSLQLDADAAARAAGGTITGLLEINVGSYYAPPPRPVELRAKVGMAAAPAVETPISAGDQMLAVDVSTRWQFSVR